MGRIALHATLFSRRLLDRDTDTRAVTCRTHCRQSEIDNSSKAERREVSASAQWHCCATNQIKIYVNFVSELYFLSIVSITPGIDKLPKFRLVAILTAEKTHWAHLYEMSIKTTVKKPIIMWKHGRFGGKENAAKIPFDRECHVSEHCMQASASVCLIFMNIFVRWTSSHCAQNSFFFQFSMKRSTHTQHPGHIRLSVAPNGRLFMCIVQFKWMR